MFKRSNKITSLLVAAAAVISLVPANATEVKKIETQEGTIYDAHSFGGGKAYIDGEVEDKDSAVYYYNDGKYTSLDAIDSGSDTSTFDIYVTVDDGDYSVNLTDGTVSDEDIQENTLDDISSALRKNIKDDTDDRYDESATAAIKDSGDSDYPIQIPGGPWYRTTYKAAEKAKTNGVNGFTTSDSDAIFNVFTDKSGKYIDADYNLGKIKVTTTNGSATIENTNDYYDLSNSEKDSVHASVTQKEMLGQDENYLYRLVYVTVSLVDGISDGIEKINGKSITGSAFTSNSDNSEVSYYAIQKISKEADSSDIDGANYSKNVCTYALSDKDGKEVSNFDMWQSALNTPPNGRYLVIDGKITIVLLDASNNEVSTVTYNLKGNNGYYYTDEEDKDTESAEVNGDRGIAVTIGSGQLYRLDSGYIYKYNNTDDWNKLYKVDGAFDAIDVANDDNMIAWNEDDSVYSIIAEESSDTKSTNKETTGSAASITTPATSTGWVKATDGTWSYVKSDGTKATGWINDSGTWYYLNETGVMMTGWINDNGTWYYCNSSGAMLSNTTVDGYNLSSTGAMI